MAIPNTLCKHRHERWVPAACRHHGGGPWYKPDNSGGFGPRILRQTCRGRCKDKGFAENRIIFLWENAENRTFLL